MSQTFLNSANRYLFLLLAAIGLFQPLTAAAKPRHPNIVILFTDDMGWGDLQCYNPKGKAPTPHMDRLAREGTLFTDAHSPASVCTPSRYALLTGRYCWRSSLKMGVRQQWEPCLVEKDRLTIGKLMQQHGYTTAAFGKWHLGWTWSTTDGKIPKPARGGDYRKTIDFSKPISEGPLSRGFDYFFGIVGNGLSYSSLIENNQPLFQGKGKPPEISGVSKELLKEPWNNDRTMPLLNDKVVWYIDLQAKKKAKQPFLVYYAMTAPHNPIMPYGRFKGATGHGGYCDFVHQLDHCVGQVLAAIDRNGMADNTMVILTSDNGSPGYWKPGSAVGSINKAAAMRRTGRIEDSRETPGKADTACRSSFAGPARSRPVRRTIA